MAQQVNLPPKEEFYSKFPQFVAKFEEASAHGWSFPATRLPFADGLQRIHAQLARNERLDELNTFWLKNYRSVDRQRTLDADQLQALSDLNDLAPYLNFVVHEQPLPSSASLRHTRPAASAFSCTPSRTSATTPTRGCAASAASSASWPPSRNASQRACGASVLASGPTTASVPLAHSTRTAGSPPPASPATTWQEPLARGAQRILA